MPRRLRALIAAMTPGLAVLAGALVIALAGGTAWRLTNGRMRSPRGARLGATGAGASVPLSPRVLERAGIRAGAGLPDPGERGTGLGDPAGAGGQAGADGEAVAGQQARADGQAGAGGATPPAGEQGIVLTGDQLGHALGERATLVQFSSAFCAPCRATRRILADVAGMTEGVSHVEIDAESRLDLVRQLNVLRTPTVLVLAGDGRVVRRASGQPRKPDVIAAIGLAVDA
jgi:thiol-disulfide isomerase/thioredoxin